MSLKKPQNLKKMLRKFPASNGWVAVFKKSDFSESSLKVTKLSKFQHFSSYLKFFSVIIINGGTILFSKHGKINRWKRWLVSVKPSSTNKLKN